ncbi:HTH_Tnp_Tc3_2 domain-containing protein [Trichonephila clavipes]|nr:HTH_Tnp_Tc3_2 domain-containing protein [Trichonephila clavipes]
MHVWVSGPTKTPTTVDVRRSDVTSGTRLEHASHESVTLTIGLPWPLLSLKEVEKRMKVSESSTTKYACSAKEKDIKIDPKLSAVKLAAETSRIGRSVSAETVSNVIRHAGYSSRVARKKSFVSLQNQKKRLEFAKTHQLKTNNFGRKLYLVTKVNPTFLEVMAVAPFGESRTPFWIQKIYILQLNMVVAPS